MSCILILEDDIALAREWQLHLRQSGHDALHATRASEALALLQLYPVELCILDFFIEPLNQQDAPDGSIRFAGALRMRPELARKRLALLGVSGHINIPYGVDPESQLGALGVREFMAKPFPPQALLERVEAMLARRSAELEPGEGNRRP